MKLEVCIDRIESAMAALSGGADRLEVCGELRVGGITPSYGLIEQCVALNQAHVMMMIRSHAGGFCYASRELQTMLRDIRVAKELGVKGVVFGALQADGSVDREACKRLIDAARPLSVTFHRAFDLTPEPLAAIETLMDLDVDRLLTSGQAATAFEGASLIRELVQLAGDNLTVIAGAGIQPQQIVKLVQATGVREIHASASVTIDEPIYAARGVVHPTQLTREYAVRELVKAIQRIA